MLKFNEIKNGDKIQAILSSDVFINKKIYYSKDIVDFIVKFIPENKFQLPMLEVVFTNNNQLEHVYDFYFISYKLIK